MTLAIPVVVPLGMRVVFGMLARRLGARRGYLGGFACYWAACYLVPTALLGRRQVAALLRQPAGPLPRPRCDAGSGSDRAEGGGESPVVLS